MQEYLGIGAPIGHDVGYTSITGGQNVFAGFGPYTLTYSAASGGPGMSNFSDRVPPHGANGLQAFTMPSGGAAVTRDGGTYRTTYWGFPFEAISGVTNREAVMARFLQWCNELVQTCHGDITGDGQVNVNDLLAVINAWGPCPAPPATCPPDIAPPGGDGQVNVNDLLGVINAWGACP
jgi:hypothetical protein